MKTVKEICLGVAVAGVVVGAGTTVACAVASADTGTDGGNSATTARSAGPSKASATRQATRVRPVAPASVASSSRSVPAAAASRVVARNSAALRPFSTAPSTPVSLLSALPVLPAAPAPASAQRTASPAAAVTASAVGGGPTKVLLIGTDGTNLSKVLANSANTGFFNLMSQSVTGATSLVGHTTISGPSWTTILTGVWDTKSGVINNIFNPAPYDKWPTVFNQLEAYNSNINTSIVADWQYLNDLADAGAYPVDNNFSYGFTDSWAATDAQVVAKTIDLINATAADSSSFIFSYQVQVDEAGHSFGGGSQEYAEAVTNVSNNIQAITNAVNAYNFGKPADQQWSIIVTTDHGHQQQVGFGHGFQSPDETSSFVIFDQAGANSNDGRQNLAYSTVDITPTIVSLFGAPARSDFDGVSLTTLASSIVSAANSNAAPGGALSQTLTDAINSFGYPDIGTDIKLGIRTIAGAVPYFINVALTSVVDSLNSIAAQDTFLVSQLAGVTAVIVGLIGGAVVDATQAVAQVIGYLTGAGTIAPSDPPLSSVPSADAVLAAGALPVL